MDLDADEIRYLLQNAGKIKKEGKCIHCDGTGWINWNSETGDDIKSGRSFEYGRDIDTCEKCDGVGYVW